MNRIFRRSASVEAVIKNYCRQGTKIQATGANSTRKTPREFCSEICMKKNSLIDLVRKLPGFPFMRKVYRKLCAHHEVRIARDQILAKLDTLGIQQNTIMYSIERIENTTERIENNLGVLLRRSVIACGDVNLIRSTSGYVVVDASDYAVQTSLVEGSELEPGVRNLLESVLYPGDTFVDVGANLGLTTLAAFRAMKGKGSFICFEPVPQTCTLLRHTLFINGVAPFATVYCTACSDTPGTHILHLGATCGHHSLYPLTGATDTGETTEVSVTTLDIALGDLSVTLLKIDAEGAEVSIMRGAQRVLENNPDIGLVVEYGASHLQRTGNNTETFLEPFKKAGFVWKRIDDFSGALCAINEQELEHLETANLFFARPNSYLWKRLEQVYAR